MSEPIQPIPLTPLSCVCGEYLEVIERGSVRDLVCPRGCVVVLAPNRRPRVAVKKSRTTQPPRICPRCRTPIVREPGHVGSTPKIHRHCRTTKEIEELAAYAKQSAAWYAANKERWKGYEVTKRRRAAGDA